jgi:probable rRNA maturation factor
MDDCHLFSDRRGRLPRREAVALAGLILKGERKKLPVNIIFTGDETLEELNLQFRRLNRPTDVLSFPADPELGILGDIYISIDTARRQAREYRATLREEILRLVCHGALHLCGYDHHKKAETALMKKKEDHYLDRYLRNA